jgi:hypothetical protein
MFLLQIHKENNVFLKHIFEESKNLNPMYVQTK